MSSCFRGLSMAMGNCDQRCGRACDDVDERSRVGLPRITGAALAAGRALAEVSSSSSGSPEIEPATEVIKEVSKPVPAAEACGEDSCAICFEAASARAWRKLACGHSFHEACVLRWVQSAHNAHCPMCRQDLEVSALADFASEMERFHTTRRAFFVSPDLLIGRVAFCAEQCRRRLYDATLIRFLKMLDAATSNDASDRMFEVRNILNELLRDLHVLREVVQKWVANSATGILEQELDSDSSLFLASLVEQLSYIQKHLRRFSEAAEEMSDLEVIELETSMRAHLAQLRQLCANPASGRPVQ